MKKITALFLCVLVGAGILSGCGYDENRLQNNQTGEDKLEIVTTIFPEYDWTKALLGNKADRANLTMLLDNGVDLHSYQPTADDIIKISTCDMFIYVGGESDEWVEDALKEAINKDMIVINLLDVLGDAVKAEEVVEGMQGEAHEHEGEDAGEDHDPEQEEIEYDEHVWLSLKNAETLCGAIAESLAVLDPDNQAAYLSNANAYIEKLSDLDFQYQSAVDNAEKKVVLFGDRFPFRYLVDDYGLDYYAAFVGCSAETEASFETVLFLANKVDEAGLSVVLTIEGTEHDIAETIISNTKGRDQQVLTMDSMQSTTSDDVNDGATYISIMEQNLDVLKEALK